MASTYLDLRAITNLSGRKIRVMTDKSVIAYPSVWPFSETRHFSQDVFPANTMAYDTASAAACGTAGGAAAAAIAAREP